MTEEEKKVIEYFKKSFTSKTPPYWYDDTIENSEIKIKTLVNLIEKLQKEKIPTKFYACDPNKYKECKKKHCYINGGECDATIDETKVKYINLENYIPKDKIREKIKELKEAIGIAKKENDISLVAELEIQTEILKELLEEG